MFVAIDYVWSKAKEDRTLEKAIFVDEAWKLLASNELAGEYLLEIFKTIRAYGGAAICATQDLVDFFALKGGKLGRGILNNSKTKIILNMENAEARADSKGTGSVRSSLIPVSILNEEAVLFPQTTITLLWSLKPAAWKRI